MYSKAQIFNLALGALLLTRRITDTTTDKSNECAVLNTHWDAAFQSALQEMNLDSTSETVTLALVTEFLSYDINGAIDGISGDGSVDPWLYAYKYPANCAFFRRIVSNVKKDNRYSHIPKRVAMYQGQKVIYTNKEQAKAEIIKSDLPLTSLSPAAGLAISYRLAFLASPLISGKGASSLRTAIDTMYKTARADAQSQDQDESFTYEEDWTGSEFVAERMS